MLFLYVYMFDKSRVFHVCDYTISASTVELFEELFGACYFHGFAVIPVGKAIPWTSLRRRRDVITS